MSTQLDPELVARARAAWRSGQASDEDVERARQRASLRWKIARRGPRLRPLAWALATVCVAGSVLASGVWIAPRLFEPPVEPPAEARVSQAASRGRPRQPEPAPVDSPARSADAGVSEHAGAHAAPPSGAPAQPASPRAAAPPRGLALGSGGGWVEVSRALQRGDTAAAHRGLDALISGRDAVDRDAAALVQAQLWIREGQGARARPRLAALAASGSTGTIRRQATRLLERQP